jgi:hypothetical protein
MVKRCCEICEKTNKKIKYYQCFRCDGAFCQSCFDKEQLFYNDLHYIIFCPCCKNNDKLRKEIRTTIKEIKDIEIRRKLIDNINDLVNNPNKNLYIHRLELESEPE